MNQLLLNLERCHSELIGLLQLHFFLKDIGETCLCVGEVVPPLGVRSLLSQSGEDLFGLLELSSRTLQIEPLVIETTLVDVRQSAIPQLDRAVTARHRVKARI